MTNSIDVVFPTRERRTFPTSRSTTISLLAASALALTLPGTGAASDLIAHEWGTFTSIQGSDGDQIVWNAVDTIDLPEFVYNWIRPGMNRFPSGRLSLFTKAYMPALQRMETPVIYFYTDQPQTVDVSVQFPKGSITEWYPQAKDIGPSLVRIADSAAVFSSNTNSVIRWTTDLLPQSEADRLKPVFPEESSENHYFAARETDANLLRVNPIADDMPAAEHEKFLFYRGVGSFTTPLHVSMSDDVLTITNTGNADLKHLLALEVQGNRASFVSIGHLTAADSTTLQWNSTTGGDAIDVVAHRISREMVEALESEGLFRREAEAMVKTWRDVWFAEPGVRILYVLPRQWTDEILPIDITPQPTELVRVMVARAEIISPAVEESIRQCIHLYHNADEDSRSNALRQFRALDLGRFAHPAIQAAIRDEQDKQFKKSAWALLAEHNESEATAALSQHTPQTPAGRADRKGG